MTYHNLVLKRYNSNQYLCYNSFAEPHWYWGPKHLSECFSLHEPLMERLLKIFSDARETLIKAHPDYAGVIEEKMGSEAHSSI